MKASTKQPKKRSTLLLENFVQLGKPDRVDREKGIIFGVKVLGLNSQNGRRYTPEAVKKAVGLYEGIGVFTDHPSTPSSSRSVTERFGWIENVRLASDGGLIGDLHILNPGTDIAESVFLAAEKNPQLAGLSHNAEGDGYRDADGTFIVEEISDVRSVDLVAEPATTGGLFEGRNRNQAMTKKLTIRKFLETVTLPKLGKAKAKPAVKALKKLLTEAEKDDACVLDEEDMGMDMPEDDAAPANGSDWRKSLATVVGQLVASEDAEAHDIAKKLQGILKPAAATTEAEGGEEDGKPVEEGTDVEESGSNEIRGSNQAGQIRAMNAKDGGDFEGRKPRKPTPGLSQLQEEVATLKKQLQAEKDAAALSTWVAEECRKRKLVDVDADLLESITASGDRKKIAVRLDKLKALAGSGQRGAPRSRFTGMEGNGGADKRPVNGKEFAELLRAGSRG